jgi:perosamine synthetase
MSNKTVGLLIPFHRAEVGEEEVRAVIEVLRSGWLTMGAKTLEFEKQFAKYVGAEHAIAVSSCTAALHLALEAIGLRPGDEVLVPTTTFTATAEVVTYLGGQPVLVDIDPSTMNMDVDEAARRVTPRTRAIMPVHFGGQPCDMQQISALADRHGLRVIEDAAHSLPASYRGRPIGSLSEFTAFSFYATKTLTTGEGGMITTSNAAAAERMRTMRLHGIARDAWKRYSADGSWQYEVIEAGFKYNMTDLQAALGLAQLAKCDVLRQARCAIAQQYTEAFHDSDALESPSVLADRRTSWHLYVLRLRLERLKINRDRFIDELRRRGIGASVHFIPLHLHPYYQRTFRYRAGDFPRAEAEYARCLSLPIYPAMTQDDVGHVIEEVLSIVQTYRN